MIYDGLEYRVYCAILESSVYIDTETATISVTWKTRILNTIGII
jgi:hypothetical protein